MLNQNQITEVEAIYIIMTSDGVNIGLCVSFVEHFYATNLEQFIYLTWLLQRWTFIRKHHGEMPTRIIHIYNHLPRALSKQCLPFFNWFQFFMCQTF